MSYHTELNIPVKKDGRTFEQHREDMLKGLERTYSSSSSTMTSSRHSSAAQPLSTNQASGGIRSRIGGDNDWDSEVSKWISESKKRWQRDISRIKSDMFALEPMDDFNLDNWGTGSSISSGTGGGRLLGDGDSMMAKMEQRMAQMREQMQSMSMLGGSSGVGSGLSDLGGGLRLADKDFDFGGPLGGNHMSSSSTSKSSHFSSSTISNGGPPLTKTMTSEQRRDERVVDGIATSSTSASRSETEHGGPGTPPKLPGQGLSSPVGIAGLSMGGRGPLVSMPTTAPLPGGLVAQSSVGGGVMDFLKDAYEIGEDGEVHFKVRFDAKDFRPEDINVTTMANRLTVHAKQSRKTETSSNTREFSRTIDLPRSIDHEKFQCLLTDDGVLILDAPVKAPDYNSITFDSERNLGIKPRSLGTNVQNADGSTSLASGTSTSVHSLALTGQSGASIVRDGAQGRKLHLEVPIDSTYTADDLCVRMDANRICVSGQTSRGGARVAGGSDTGSSTTALSTGSEVNTESMAAQRFSRSFEIPETVDPFSVTAQLIGQTLVIEAPLMCTV